MLPDEGRRRVVIEAVQPEIDAGRFPIKRVLGEQVEVEADIFTDGHDVVTSVVRYRTPGASEWHEIPMQFLDNDRWSASFPIKELGRYTFTVRGWVDHYKAWSRDLVKRVEAKQVAPVDLLIGAALVEATAPHARGLDATRLNEAATALRAGGDDGVRLGLDPQIDELMFRYAERRYATDYDRELSVWAEPLRARYSSWYSLFPRSTSEVAGVHGTFRDVIKRLPYLAELGFDVLYLTPIHPIGQTFRKGKDNAPTAQAGEPGSPYAIGSPEGGHKSIHAELGTLEDFHALVAAAKTYDIQIAIDNAFQSSPDHPYVNEHPEWFRQRPDGTIQYAENPPKKYQDIYPFDFESEDWQGLWQELKSFFDFWIAQGVTIFRVDNPHTKSFQFWGWCIDEIKAAHPEAIFLSEAFTRPKVMYNLAKLGFTQSYTYFTWRTVKAELTEYLTELTRTEVKEYFRPSFWPNTHDILTPQFYEGQRSTFLARAALAATLSASWGIYGPSYELLEHVPAQGREEYSNNEKYELRVWDLNALHSIRGFIAALNRARRENIALQSNGSLRFHRVDTDYVENEYLIAYSKHSDDFGNIVLTVVNLDPLHAQAGWLHVPLSEWGLDGPVQARELLSDTRVMWNEGFNAIALNPSDMPVAIFQIEP